MSFGAPLHASVPIKSGAYPSRKISSASPSFIATFSCRWATPSTPFVSLPVVFSFRQKPNSDEWKVPNPFSAARLVLWNPSNSAS